MVANRRTSRSNSGLSVIELMLTALIMGFVVAGIMQALFVNLAWFRTLSNRVDNGLAARNFVRILGDDIRNSYKVDTLSRGDKLILHRPPTPVFTEPAVLFDSQAYSTIQAKIDDRSIVYEVIADPSQPTGFYKILYSNSGTTGTRTILQGVLGPLSPATGSPLVFQYVDKESPCTQSDNASDTTGSVVLNLELRRKLYGQDTGAFGAVDPPPRDKSAIAFRTEFMLRNNSLHGDN
ncbi:MAG: hypothetical protein Q8T09_15045 [Candidatus Melainabacteria bacterium]|nr:hypothetical protein [Candidatus Melainabacteria bacterium]